MTNRHIDLDRLLEYALSNSLADLEEAERIHLSQCPSCQEQAVQYSSSLHDSTHEPISNEEMETFRRTFFTAWHKKEAMNLGLESAIAHQKKIHRLRSMAWIAVFVVLLTGAGYMNLPPFLSPSSPSQVLLLQGQRIIDRPEILSLMPPIDSPTVISTIPGNANPQKEQFVVHGYLEENTVQIVWQL